MNKCKYCGDSGMIFQASAFSDCCNRTTCRAKLAKDAVEGTGYAVVVDTSGLPGGSAGGNGMSLDCSHGAGGGGASGSTGVPAHGGGGTNSGLFAIGGGGRICIQSSTSFSSPRDWEKPDPCFGATIGGGGQEELPEPIIAKAADDWPPAYWHQPNESGHVMD